MKISNAKKFAFTFSFADTKPPTDFFVQNSVQFGHQAKRGDPPIVDLPLLVPREESEPLSQALESYVTLTPH